MRPPGAQAARALLSAVTAAAAVVAVGLLPAAMPPAGAPAATPATATGSGYTWSNVAIGGGGFVDGIEFNEGRRGLVYARTDVGGAYRWDAGTSSWTPLLDSLGWQDWNLTGVLSLATDAADPARVYVAAGSYTNSWDPNDGAILRSDDQGATWQRTTMPFKIGGNMPGRGMGERLAIDPGNDKVLYFGAESGHGLWRSEDYGATWSQLTSLPDTGPYAPDPSDGTGYQSDPEGVLWEVFDPGSGTVNGVTRTVYVGVADKTGDSVYVTKDGGSTWASVSGQPTGMIPHHAVLDAAGGNLYVAYGDTGGPYDGAHGDLWKYSTGSGTWTDVSPVPSSDSSDNYFGYSGLSVDRQHPGTLMVTGYSSWWPDTRIWRSTDGGATWKPFWSYSGYPNRTDDYTLDDSAYPWLDFGTASASPPVEAYKLGWMTEALAVDPFDSGHMLYGTGATLYGTDDLTDLDAGKKITIRPVVKGLEETAVNDLISPPSGAPLLSALGDLGGFRHTDVTQVPSTIDTSPTFTTATSLDFAEGSPGVIVRVGDLASGSTDKHIGYSTDDGADWWAPAGEPSGVTGGGTVAIAADGSSTVWSPQGTGVYHASGYGNSWAASTGIPAGATVASDRVDPKTFYGFAAGRFYLSTDGGATFTATAAGGLPVSGNVRFKALPGAKGDIWLAGGSTGGAYGLWHSTDGGADFTRLAGVDQADTIGFGKAAPGRSYPALYTSAQIGGVRGIFRSDDAGADWVRINDDAHQWGWTGAAITGDPRIYGRVYVSTNGRGIIYGDIGGGGTATPSASASASVSASAGPSASGSPSASASPSAGGTGPASGGCEIDYTVTSEWSGGFGASVTLVNHGSSAIGGWTVAWTFPDGQRITSLWNGSYTQSGAAVQVSNLSYNGALAAGGGSTSFGFNGSWSGSDDPPAAASLNGTACALRTG